MFVDVRCAAMKTHTAVLMAVCLTTTGLGTAVPTIVAAQTTTSVEPLSADPEVLDAGRKLYIKNCSHCHGFNMVNPGTVSFDLRKFPKEDPQRFFASVLQGRGAMPAWKQSPKQASSSS